LAVDAGVAAPYALPTVSPDEPDEPPPGDITRLLQSWSEGSGAARDELARLVYDELHRRAVAMLRRESRGHTLRPTALVHEAYLRLVGQRTSWRNSSHFFGVASQAMRRVLVDHARARHAAKRAEGGLRVELTEALASSAPRDVDLLALDAALDALAERDSEQARMVELRFFGGLSHEEAADVMGVSLAAAKREWSLAKAWLFRRLRKDAGDAGTA
jgi:RNA polymerase sigma factor (TIGR02999 family)